MLAADKHLIGGSRHPSLGSSVRLQGRACQNTAPWLGDLAFTVVVEMAPWFARVPMRTPTSCYADAEWSERARRSNTFLDSQ